MDERERNRQLLILMQKLVLEDDKASIELIRTMANNDTPAMRKSFSIIINGWQTDKLPRCPHKNVKEDSEGSECLDCGASDYT
jgi:hypothetical protein